MDVVTWQPAAAGIWRVTMASPPANALSGPLLDGLHAALDAAGAAGAAGEVKVLVVSSAVDRFFAAGADIKHMAAIDAASFTAYGDRMRAVNDRLAAAPFLSVAAVDGLALGGGLELAMAATMRVSGPRARFGLPEVKLGLIPGAGGTQRLPRLVGRGRALDIMLTGRQVPAAEALAIGLVDRLTEGNAAEAALALAGELAGASLPAQRAVVAAVDAASDLPLGAGLDFEAERVQALFEHGEAAEGIAAFTEITLDLMRALPSGGSVLTAQGIVRHADNVGGFASASIHVAYPRPVPVGARVRFAAQVVHLGRAFGVVRVTANHDDSGKLMRCLQRRSRRRRLRRAPVIEPDRRPRL